MEMRLYITYLFKCIEIKSKSIIIALVIKHSTYVLSVLHSCTNAQAKTNTLWLLSRETSNKIFSKHKDKNDIFTLGQPQIPSKNINQTYSRKISKSSPARRILL